MHEYFFLDTIVLYLFLVLFPTFRDAVSKKPIVHESIVAGKGPKDIPLYRIRGLEDVRCHFTGPGAGATGVHPASEGKPSCSVCCGPWSERHERADGVAISLYDEAKNGRVNPGDPIADVFGVVLYRNGSFLSVADGVNWGEKSRLAARCAVHGSLDYLEQNIQRATTTQEIIAHLLMSFDNAQKLIINKEATMTTLVTCCVFQVTDGRWAVCAVNVGDSLAYVYSPSSHIVREVTINSHQGERDVREAGGALGPSDGYRPDLGNLTCSFTFVEPEDILFATSDGVSDNFDPVVIKHASTSRTSEHPDRPYLSPEERDEDSVRRMSCTLREEMPSGHVQSASDVAVSLLRHVVAQTEPKRRCLEEATEDPKNEREILSRSKQLPGKLDHATVAAVQVGMFLSTPTEEQKQKCETLAVELFNL